jgi:hypothetical protein
MSLDGVFSRHGYTQARVGAWERGDRQPPTCELDLYVRKVFEHELALVPVGFDVDEVLAELRELRTFKAHIVDGYARISQESP